MADCQKCRLRKYIAEAYDLHWTGKEDCPCVCPEKEKKSKKKEQRTGGNMILSCPFRCFIKTQYGICRAGKCMNSKFKAIWNGDEIDRKQLLKFNIEEKDITSKGLCEYIKEMGGKK